MVKIKGIKERRLWASFAPDGEIQVRSIAETKREAKEFTVGDAYGVKWSDYAAKGFTTNRVLVDIKIIA